jgi:hypothetical protein
LVTDTSWTEAASAEPRKRTTFDDFPASRANSSNWSDTPLPLSALIELDIS